MPPGRGKPTGAPSGAGRRPSGRQHGWAPRRLQSRRPVAVFIPSGGRACRNSLKGTAGHGHFGNSRPRSCGGMARPRHRVVWELMGAVAARKLCAEPVRQSHGEPPSTIATPRPHRPPADRLREEGHAAIGMSHAARKHWPAARNTSVGARDGLSLQHRVDTPRPRSRSAGRLLQHQSEPQIPRPKP
jgi:hypothetical protein